jgi:hypothetical protein
MEQLGKSVGGIKRSNDTNVMAAGDELLGQSLDVSVHSTPVRPRIRADEGDSHEPSA